MPVTLRHYRRYEGPRTAGWRRIAVVHGYARRRVFRSRLLSVLFFLCLAVPLTELIAVYLAHNLDFLRLFGGAKLIQVDGGFFMGYLHYACDFAFLFTAFAAPGLLSPDLTHGVMGLYLARPLSRWEYLAGKFSALALLLSWVTWVPALIIWAVQCSLGGAAWRAQYAWLGVSIVAASLIWIVVLSLVALAISAWVRWRIVAAGILLAVDFFGAGLSTAINAALDTKFGDLLSFTQLHLVVWTDLFRQPPLELSLVRSAWLVLAAIAVGSLVLVLRRVRGVEVVR